MAFEIAHNLTLKGAISRIDKVTKNSYYLGVSAGSVKIARAQKREEENRAYEIERRRGRSSL